MLEETLLSHVLSVLIPESLSAFHLVSVLHPAVEKKISHLLHKNSFTKIPKQSMEKACLNYWQEAGIYYTNTLIAGQLHKNNVQ